MNPNNHRSPIHTSRTKPPTVEHHPDLHGPYEYL